MTPGGGGGGSCIHGPTRPTVIVMHCTDSKWKFRLEESGEIATLWRMDNDDFDGVMCRLLRC